MMIIIMPAYGQVQYYGGLFNLLFLWEYYTQNADRHVTTGRPSAAQGC